MSNETEYFVVLADVRQPWLASHLVGGISTRYISGETPEEALMGAVNEYSSYTDPLYAAYLYRNADEYHRHKGPILVWYSDAAKVSGTLNTDGRKRGMLQS